MRVVPALHNVPAPRGRAIGDAGNDNMILTAVSRPVWLYGDGGNDVLMAGSGGSLIFGGDGNDQLFGSSGRDILIGGENADNLFGSGSDDILIAGRTNYDSRPLAGHEEFWCDVWSEWHRANGFAARVQNLRDGAGGSAHNNGSFLQPNVVDDLMAGSVDLLVGGAGSDWLLFQAGEDSVAGPAEASN